MAIHQYKLGLEWTGNIGQGTSGYQTYQRNYTISANDKAPIYGSSDPAFRGDKSRYNPEELLLASLSSCHMLWYLHLCTEAGVVVLTYADQATATMQETEDGGGHFTGVTLNPVVTVADQNMIEKANVLHKQANERCFIANSVNFPVSHKPVCTVASFPLS